jgi:hypothetical protein
VKRRWEALIGVTVAAIAIVPFATAGAQAPPTAADGSDETVEGTSPPGGDVNCTTGPTLTPDHGPPGTEVTVTASFEGNCDEFSALLYGLECEGTVTGDGVELTFPFAFADIAEPAGSGTFTAPATEPNPPVVDAIEPLTVTISCTTGSPGSSAGSPEGGSTTNYHYPPVTYDLELFAAIDTDQPTQVDNDPTVDDGGVVAATPTFTG